LGHAYSALKAWRFAQEAGGRFLLRIEDIDRGRCRSEFEKGIYEDLGWLGIEWETPVRRQSEHLDDYQDALGRLDHKGLTYPCFCTRREIAAEIAASPSAPHGPAGPVYPGTCKALSVDERSHKIGSERPFSIRLDFEEAQKRLLEQNLWPLHWEEATGPIEAQPQDHGDVILARKDTPTSYHLAVTIDDHMQRVSHVIRGRDLAASTHIHRLLQTLMGLDTPLYRHHRLVTDNKGQRLAKRDPSLTIAGLRESGKTREDVLRRLANL
jgi:glutamyl-Q tRNA(Asp) synthetase